MKRFLLSIVLVAALFITSETVAQGKFSPQVRSFWNSGQVWLPPVALTGTAGALTLSSGTVFTLSGTTKQTSIVTSTADAGRMIVLITASTDTLVDGSNLKLAGDFEGTANDCLILISDGTNWYEISRSAN